MARNTMNGRERILAVCEGRAPDRLPFMPITMMFAADFSGVKYGEYAREHRVLAEAQARVAEAFDIDHVSTISDPAREAADCGARIEYFPDQPPAIDEGCARLAEKAELAHLCVPDPLGGGRMHDRVLGVSLLRERAGQTRLVEGWIEGPCAEAADLRGINALMMDFYEDPGFVRDLFEFALEMELGFAKAQCEAGADLMGVGDAAASLIGPSLYEEFVWPYEKRLVDGLHAMGLKVRLHICGNTQPILAGMGQLGCEIVDLDYMVAMDEARRVMGAGQTLLGNLDPVAVVRGGTPDSVAAAVAECHRQVGARFIVGAGCEIVRDTPHANLRAMGAYAQQSLG